MIVKDEASCIERCLTSVLPCIDSYVIVDTGSTDDTVKRIQERMAGIPGFVGSRPWVNYSHNRNESFALARGFVVPKPTHILFMDASDVFEGSFQGLSEGGILRHRADAFKIKHTMGDCEWRRPALVSADLPWYWSGKVHEVLLCSKVTVSENLDGCEIKCNVGQPFQGRDRFLRDAALLEGETDPRSVFYRAQSWLCADEKEKALEDYRKRARMKGGFDQEAYVSNIQVHLLSGETFPLHCAKDGDPLRVEAWYYLGLSSLKEGKLEDANGYLSKAATLASVGVPEHALFAHKPIYAYKALACYALLTQDKEAAREVIGTPGAEYPVQLLELAQ